MWNLLFGLISLGMLIMLFFTKTAREAPGFSRGEG